MKTRMALLALTLTACGGAPAPLVDAAGHHSPTPVSLDVVNVEAAVAYSAQNRGSAVVVWQGGREVLAQGQNGFGLNEPHMLASGSKGLSCAVAAALRADGRLSYDEPAGRTLTEWSGDPLKSTVTVRHLLTFTAGLPANAGSPVGGQNEDMYAAAVAASLVSDPGERFTYGNAHLAAFGEVVVRRAGQGPHTYLQARVLDRIGAVAIWDTDQAGNPQLAGGASMTARDWARFGQLIEQQGHWEGQQVLPEEALRACFEGTAQLAAFGFGWWLNMPLNGTLDRGERLPLPALADGVGPYAPSAPADTVMAAGFANQRLYVIPSLDVVVVRFAEGGVWSDETFLSLLLGN